MVFRRLLQSQGFSIVSLEQRLYLIVYPDSIHNTDIVTFQKDIVMTIQSRVLLRFISRSNFLGQEFLKFSTLPGSQNVFFCKDVSMIFKVTKNPRGPKLSFISVDLT